MATYGCRSAARVSGLVRGTRRGPAGPEAAPAHVPPSQQLVPAASDALADVAPPHAPCRCPGRAALLPHDVRLFHRVAVRLRATSVLVTGKHVLPGYSSTIAPRRTRGWSTGRPTADAGADGRRPGSARSVTSGRRGLFALPGARDPRVRSLRQRRAWRGRGRHLGRHVAGRRHTDGHPCARDSARNLVLIVGDGRIHRHWSAAPPAWRLACLRWGSSRARPPRPAFHRLAATVPACAEAAAPRPETFATLDVVVSVDSRRTSCGQARGGQTIHSLFPSGHVVCPHPMTPEKSSGNNKL